MASSPVWLITGASSGFGLLLAKHAASHGQRVIAASRNPEKLRFDDAAGIRTAKLDPNQTLEEIKATMKDIVAIYGTIDIVVNNAGYVQTGTLEEVTPEDTFRQFQVNVFGPLNIYRAVLPYLREKKSGTLVTIGSMAAWYPMASCNLYNASKAALRWLGIGLADEIAPFGIRHCLIEPGFFRTELLNPNANITSTSSTERIPDYAEMNATADGNFAKFHGAQLGDPVKGVEVIYDVITSSGHAAGKDLPEFFALGSDAVTEISKSASQTLACLTEWKEISAISDFPEGQ
ncbi:hypothetical protein GX51_05970 [Blastomyces parvus]|uniref:Short-chain dehydrogenase/reductase SDR n=1 Tax=Blastomyces parvus TaxID=2060905 RepID=A0A2B7WUE3_9EURO|nr:hypothetical protein GX51_05970 [Blastomyces parvus]